MALSVSACPGKPTCWVLDAQAGLDPTPAFRTQRHWTRMPTAPAQAFWRKRALARFSRANKTLTGHREGHFRKGAKHAQRHEVYKN